MSKLVKFYGGMLNVCRIVTDLEYYGVGVLSTLDRAVKDLLREDLVLAGVGHPGGRLAMVLVQLVSEVVEDGGERADLRTALQATAAALKTDCEAGRLALLRAV